MAELSATFPRAQLPRNAFRPESEMGVIRQLDRAWPNFRWPVIQPVEQLLVRWRYFNRLVLLCFLMTTERLILRR